MEHRPSDRDIAVERKRAAARAAVAEVEDRMLVGLGTGTTTDFAIAALGERIAGGLKVTAVVTSGATERSAAAAGVPVRRFDALVRPASAAADEVRTWVCPSCGAVLDVDLPECPHCKPEVGAPSRFVLLRLARNRSGRLLRHCR